MESPNDILIYTEKCSGKHKIAVEHSNRIIEGAHQIIFEMVDELNSITCLNYQYWIWPFMITCLVLALVSIVLVIVYISFIILSIFLLFTIVIIFRLIGFSCMRKIGHKKRIIIQKYQARLQSNYQIIEQFLSGFDRWGRTINYPTGNIILRRYDAVVINVQPGQYVINPNLLLQNSVAVQPIPIYQYQPQEQQTFNDFSDLEKGQQDTYQNLQNNNVGRVEDIRNQNDVNRADIGVNVYRLPVDNQNEQYRRLDEELKK